MASKVFIDVNILLDFTLKRENYAISKKIIELAVSGDIQAYITPAIVHITAYWLTKAYGNTKTKELIQSLLEYTKVIDANHQTVLHAVYSKFDDIEDALQYFTAIYHKMDYFLTRDKPLIKQELPKLPIYTPEQFIDYLLQS